MNYHFSKPSLLLSPYVKQYWGLDSCVLAGNEHIQRIVPNGLMELMFYLGDKPHSQNLKKSIPDHTVLAGQQKENYDLRVTGNMNIFSVSFHPHGAMMFFDIPMSELYDQNVPLRFLLKDTVDKLETKMYEASGFDEKKAIVESFLLQELKRNFKKYEVARISKIVETINQFPGKINIESLASTACLSRKQFERIFAECIGSSPKHLLRIVRFQHAIFIKQRRRNFSLIDLAYHCGYYDQAHMVNEFKSLSGLTPVQYFSGCEAYSDYFS